MARHQVSDEEVVSQPEHGSAPAGTLLTVLGAKAKVDGKFDIADSIEVECEIGGELKIGGKLVIGENGVVRADVETVDCIVRGTYEGKMVATGSVEISTTGRVNGNIETDSLVIHRGGYFRGNVVRIHEGEDRADLTVVPDQAPAAESASPGNRIPVGTRSTL